MTRTPVLIVGAGPTGLVLALWLTRSGVSVRIIDEAAAPGTTSRALGVQARTLEFYSQIGLADAVVERARDLVTVAAFQPFFDPCWIDLDAQKDCAVHRRGEWLRASHSAKTTAENKFSLERAVEVLATGRGKSLERALHDSLAADVNP